MEGVVSTTGTVGGAAAVAAGETAGAVVVVVGAVTGVVAGAAAAGVAGDASTPDCSAAGVRVGTNSDALGFNEAELGLTEATAVGAAIWRMAGTAAVRSWVVLTAEGRIGSTR